MRPWLVRGAALAVLAVALVLVRVTLDHAAAEMAIIEAEALMGRGRYDAAEAALLPALGRLPDDARLWRELGRVRYLRYAFRRHDEDGIGSVEAYRQAAAANPLDGLVLNDLGWAASFAGAPTLAEDAFLAALARDPHNQHYHYSLGRFLEQHERWEEAAEAYRAALAVGRAPEIRRRLSELESRP